MASSSSTAPPPKDVAYNIQHNAIDNPTSVSRVYNNIDSLLTEKSRHAEGAPAFKGRRGGFYGWGDKHKFMGIMTQKMHRFEKNYLTRRNGYIVESVSS